MPSFAAMACRSRKMMASTRTATEIGSSERHKCFSMRGRTEIATQLPKPILEAAPHSCTDQALETELPEQEQAARCLKKPALHCKAVCLLLL